MAKLMIGKSAEVAAWAAGQIPWLSGPEGFGPCEAWGIMNDETMTGAIIFTNHQKDIGDICFDVIAPNGNWGADDIWATISDYVFNVLKCERLTMVLPKAAKVNRALAERVGFVMEGTRRKAYPGGVNAIMYGMLREDCRWLTADKAAA